MCVRPVYVLYVAAICFHTRLHYTPSREVRTRPFCCRGGGWCGRQASKKKLDGKEGGMRFRQQGAVQHRIVHLSKDFIFFSKLLQPLSSCVGTLLLCVLAVSYLLLTQSC